MNILLTGATGFIGKRLLSELQKSNRVHVLVRPETILSDTCLKNVFVFSDNIESLSAYLAENNIDGIIHLASLYIAQHQTRDVKDLILSNIFLGTALLEASKKAGIKWFLNTGSIWQNYISDSKEYCPVNLYAATKQSFIDIARYYIEISDLRFCTLKLCDTYGVGDTRRKILALFKQIAMTGERLAMSPGEQRVDLLHINDVIDGFLTMISLLASDRQIEEEYKLTSGRLITLRELAQLYMKVSCRELYIDWGGREYREREVMVPWQGGVVLPEWSPKKMLEEGIAEFSRL